jgi:predicted metal-binding membrane protein
MEARPSVTAVPRRERAYILAGLFGVTALAWGYLVAMAAGMGETAGVSGGMEDMAAMAAARLAAWSPLDWVLMLAMWAVMMVGMMLPSATPTILLFAAVRRKQRARGHDIAPVAAFVFGYVAAWTAFSVAAVVLQWGLERLALLTPMMAAASAAFGGAVLIAAGLYQLGPLKHRCLEHCRSPIEFLSRRWRPGVAGAVAMGLEHGAYCVGCCWVLMALLFVGGVMNLLWVAAIAAFVLIEKVAPKGNIVHRVAGLFLVGWGILTLV